MNHKKLRLRSLRQLGAVGRTPRPVMYINLFIE